MSETFVAAAAVRATDLSAFVALLAVLESDTVRCAIEGHVRPQPAPLHLAHLLECQSGHDKRFAVTYRLWEAREEAGTDRMVLTYGELPLTVFHQLLDAACEGLDLAKSTFCDLGSGAGRLVLAAAGSHQWRKCLGLEAVPELHALGMELRSQAVATTHSLSPCDLRLLEVTTENAASVLGSVDVLFTYSTAFDETELLETLTIGLRPGAIAITIDTRLGEEGELPEATGLAFRLMWHQAIDLFVSHERTVLEESLGDEACYDQSTAFVWQRL